MARRGVTSSPPAPWQGLRLRCFETAEFRYEVGKVRLVSAVLVGTSLGKTWLAATWEGGEVEYFNLDHVLKLVPEGGAS